MLVALKYHPDRNPGNELESNSKFQAIQSANEILTDPVQRAKYDAQRMRAGLLHTYAGTSPPAARPPVPPRAPATGFSNFPPPPRPPPPPAPKSNIPPQPAGSQKYSNVRFSRPETAATWGATGADDTKAKTNDYKAWEQMRTRHGHGPIPSSSTAPPRTPRASTFQPGREPASATSAGTSSRPSGWDRWQESKAGVTGIGKKASTTRPSPNRSRFAPATPGGDEPQAHGSAYFKVSARTDRPTNTRSQTHMPPPPSPVPTAMKPDPLQAFKEQAGLSEPFGKKKSRAGTHFQRGNGEGVKVNLSPNTLHRSATSATPRSSSSHTGFYDGKSASGTAPHVRAASASSNHHSTSPPGRKATKMPGMYSSSSSSASSSDDDAKRPSSVKTQLPRVNKKQPNGPGGAQPPRGFNLYAKNGDEKMAPQASVGGEGYSSVRRHSAIDLAPEGFQEHRQKLDAERSPQSASAVRTHGSPAQNGSQPPLARSHSWQDKSDHRAKWGSPPKDTDSRSGAGAGGEAGKPPMYETRGYNPFSSPPSCGPPSLGTPPSDKWSDQWPFMSPKKPRAATAETPPYWAIPSCLPPLKETEFRKRAHTHIASRFDVPKALQANYDPFFDSFNVPTFTQKNPPGAAPFRTQSSDHIDTKFSPDTWHAKFFEAPPASHTSTPLRGVSPPKSGISHQQQQTSADAFNKYEDRSATPTASVPPPPPPTGQDKYLEERWVQQLNNITFDVPPSDQARSPIRTNPRKRTRPRGPKLATAQPTVNDVDDDPTASSTTGESLESSKASSDVDAMDIDEPTPPKANESAKTGTTAVPNGVAHKPRRVPTLPPRTNGFGQPHGDAFQLNLGDLKQVYPLAPSHEGLGNMNDMVTNLPFESRASPTKPATDGSLRRLDLPQPPFCPANPQSLTESSCDRYGRRIRQYMNEWNNFNSKMASILTARKGFLHDSSGCDWFDIQDNGYDNYMKGLAEHERVREHYGLACEKHQKSMQDLGSLRTEMKRGRGGVPG